MKKLQDALSSLKINLSSEQLTLLEKYKQLLIESNKRVNLTRISEADIDLLHFADSLLINEAIDLNNHNRVIDVGTGAGFPGIPLAICFPHLEITLIDSALRKVDFLGYALSKLQLKNCTPLHARAEDLAQNSDHSEQYDLAVARALSEIGQLKKLLMPFLSNVGLMVAYKGQREEKDEDCNDIIEVSLPNTEIQRTFMLFRKGNE